MNKSNFRACVERLGIDKSKYKSQIIGHYVIGGNINHCYNHSQVDDKSELENLESIIKETPTPVNGKNNNIETSLRLAKQETIRQLVKVGLTAEQIAQVLDLPLEEVQEKMR
ncbi:hypothetical protein [Kamptonema sp. UHCC 0994]|uniref:hypothetical protein n=1 Tax=Kamptonema sp. UHCC 0994 TaxID=3031329 RepID=UPI0023B8E9B4|nr:hypothetical protein [Kamptonema sp. UHCC 0994]MDF0552078.1 hypothetical protein [Kamptonema sp. UHCC 0994]